MLGAQPVNSASASSMVVDDDEENSISEGHTYTTDTVLVSALLHGARVCVLREDVRFFQCQGIAIPLYLTSTQGSADTASCRMIHLSPKLISNIASESLNYYSGIQLLEDILSIADDLKSSKSENVQGIYHTNAFSIDRWGKFCRIMDWDGKSVSRNQWKGFTRRVLC